MKFLKGNKECKGGEGYNPDWFIHGFKSAKK
jgi:hypothetical protein